MREMVVDVSDLADPDCGTVDALARLELAAGRLGRRVVLRGACGELRELIVLAGLDEVLPCEQADLTASRDITEMIYPLTDAAARPDDGRQASGESVWQAEEREEPLGVEEEDDPADPVP